MQFREAVSWAMGTLQRNLIPCLEECGERPLTEKERQLVSILAVLQIEKFVGRPCWVRSYRAQKKAGPRRPPVWFVL